MAKELRKSRGEELFAVAVREVFDAVAELRTDQSTEWTEELKESLMEFADIIAEPTDLPPEREFDFEINLESDEPPKERTYRMSPAELQETMMNRVLSPYLGKFCVVYLDDVLIYSKTAEEHLEHIRLVLRELQRHHLHIKLSKCSFGRTSVEFLGHIVEAGQIKMDPRKVEAVQQWPVPKTVKDGKAESFGPLSPASWGQVSSAAAQRAVQIQQAASAEQMSQMVAEMRTIAHDAATAATRAVVQELRQPSLSPKPDPGDTAHHAATSAPAPALVPAPMPPPLSPGSLGDDLGALPVAPPRQLGAHDLGRSLKTALSQFSTTDSWPIYRDDFLAHLTTVNPVLVAVLLGARPPAHGLTAESFSLLQQQLSATLTVVMKSHPTAATRLRNLRRSDTFAAADNPGTLAWDQLCTHLDCRGVARTVRHLLALQQPQSPSEDQGAFTQRMLNAYHELNDSPVSLHSNVLHENVLVAATLAGMHNTVARDTILSALDAAETRAEDISYGRLCDMMHRHPTTPDSKPTRPGQDVAAFAAAMHTQLHSQVEAAVVAAMARAPPPARPPYARPPRGGPQNNARQHPPTTPCRICESKGQGKRFHWHAHCPLNQAPAAPTAAPPPAPATHQAVVSPVSAASAFSDELSHMMAFLGNPDSAAPNAMMAHAGPSGIHAGFLSVFCGKAAAPLPVAASGMFLVDGGANICMEPDVSRFRAYSPLTTPVPCSGLGVDILGFGSIDISVVYSDGVSRPLTVRAAHAPGMTARGAPTILSQEYLRREHGVSFSYPARGAPSATDSHGSLVLTMVNDLPFLTGGHAESPGAAPPSACLAYKGPPESPPDAHRLHLRLGHPGRDGMKALLRSESVVGVPAAADAAMPDCEPCIMGKLRHASVSRAPASVVQPFSAFSSDVFGPMDVPGVGGAKFLLGVIDHYSNCIWLAALSSKRDIITQLRLVLLQIRTICSKAGQRRFAPSIKFDCDPNYLDTACRSMVRECGFSDRLPSPTAANGAGGVPYCLLHGVPRVDLSDLRVFGCTAYLRLEDRFHLKLEPRALKCMLVGQCDDGPGYWLYNLQSGRVIRSVHVAFLEGIPAHAPPPSTPADVPPCAHLAGPSQDAARSASPFAAAAATATPVFSRPTKRPAPPASPASDWHELDASPVPPAVAPGQYPPASRIPVPDTIKQALAGKYHKEWRASIVSELRSLRARNTFAYARLPVGRHAIGNKWVFKVKANSDGSVNRFKARLVAQGFSQQAGVDYHATFSPVVKLSTLRTCLAVAAARGMHIHQIDIETAFLNASLKEEIYMRQPKGAEDGTDNVLRLLKSIYGLKQASREWYELIHKTLTGLGLARSNSDTSMYSMNHPRYGICIVLVYVDDILVVSDSVEWIRSAKSAIGAEFNMTDFGEAAFVLGMDLTRCWASGTIRLSQEQYTLELLEKYGMQDCSPAKTPMGSGHYTDLASASDADKAPLSREDHETYRAILGSVNFLTMCTRPDLAFAISVLSRFQSAPQKIHLMQLKRVLRYLKGTPGMGINYGATEPGGARLVVYSDSDWAADTSNRRSQSGDISMLNGGAYARALHQGYKSMNYMTRLLLDTQEDDDYWRVLWNCTGGPV
eukprot:jgi/Tetstr1/457903/TSEL_044421.t1